MWERNRFGSLDKGVAFREFPKPVQKHLTLARKVGVYMTSDPEITGGGWNQALPTIAFVNCDGLFQKAGGMTRRNKSINMRNDKKRNSLPYPVVFSRQNRTRHPALSAYWRERSKERG